jgi:hypothetical protein
MRRDNLRNWTLAVSGLLGSMTALSSSAAHAQGGQGHAFAVSAVGPGAHRGAGSFGLGVAALNGGGAYPALSFSYTYGIADPADFYLESDFGIVVGGGAGVIGFLRPGFLVRFTPRGGFTFGIRAAPDLVFLAAGGSNGGALAGGTIGVSPGLVMGFGTKRMQFSIFADVPMYFAGAVGSSVGGGAGGGFVATLRPTASFEAGLNQHLGFFIKATPTFALSGGFGFAWVTTSIGLTF